MSKARELANLGNAYSDGALSNRNLIINSQMAVAQRGTTSTAEDFQTVDRFRINLTGGLDELAFTQSQDTDAPDDFTYSYKFTTTTPESAVTDDEWARMIYGGIEGQDLQNLAYGTSAAKQITLSFWVKSNVTGTYAVLLYRQDGVRGVTKNYTIDTADTWEYKAITFDGDTAVGINNDNARGIQIFWTLSAGPNRKTTAAPSWQDYAAGQAAYGQTADVAGTTGGYFQLTGVQLEVGDTATPFEHRSYGQELALCQRYYYKATGSIHGTPGSVGYALWYFKTSMRTAPTITGIANGTNDYTTIDYASIYTGSGYPYFNNPTADAEL